MEMDWIVLLIILSISVSFVVKLLLNPSRRRRGQLPPGPATFPILTNFLWLRQSPLEFESLLRSFLAKYGPIITLHVGPFPFIVIADRSIAHKALVQNGAVFADRPPALAVNKILASSAGHLHNITSAPYGPFWRLLRRNLAAEMLHPSRLRAYSGSRKWVLDVLVGRLLCGSQSEEGSVVVVVEHFQFAMFRLLVLMCFGDKLKENQILEIQQVQREMLVNLQRFIILNLWPKLMKILLRSRWKAYLQLKSKQEKVLIPFIKARQKIKQEIEKGGEESSVVSYVDTLLDLQHTDEKRNLTESEIVNLCSEFLNAGTDTTATTLQWIMANLVKYPKIQHKLFEDIRVVMGNNTTENEEVKEEDLGKLPYLKAVILEGLRRHPPGHFVLPHAVKEDTMLENYFIPKNGTVNFLAGEIGWDPEVWEDPMAFKPERFMNGDREAAAFDITGSKEIKMMPFGVGRRICPGATLAMLHLEYFVANLVWRFEWKGVEGEEVDLSEKMEFTIVMKKPLKAHIIPRF